MRNSTRKLETRKKLTDPFSVTLNGSTVKVSIQMESFRVKYEVRQENAFISLLFILVPEAALINVFDG